MRLVNKNDPRYYQQYKMQMQLIQKNAYAKELQNRWLMETLIHSIPKYTFIHPTKVAGSAFIKYVEEHYPYHFEYKGHHVKVSQVQNPIIFIRDPYDRFISMYKYWKYGSSDYKDHQHKRDHLEKVSKYSIKDFIQFVKNRDPILVTPFTSFTHILPQSWWIQDSDYSKTLVIYYDREKMEEKVFALLNFLEKKDILLNKKIPFTKINVSDGNSTEKIVLDMEDQEEIFKIYKDDFELIRKVKEEYHLFQSVF